MHQFWVPSIIDWFYCFLIQFFGYICCLYLWKPSLFFGMEFVGLLQLPRSVLMVRSYYFYNNTPHSSLHIFCSLDVDGATSWSWAQRKCGGRSCKDALWSKEIYFNRWMCYMYDRIRRSCWSFTTTLQCEALLPERMHSLIDQDHSSMPNLPIRHFRRVIGRFRSQSWRPLQLNWWTVIRLKPN